MPRDKAALTIDSIGRSEMTPEWRVRREQGWGSYQFMYTLSGSGIGEVAGHPSLPTPADVLIMPKDKDHRYRAQQGVDCWTYLWIEFDGALVPPIMAMLGLTGRVVIPGCDAAGDLVERVFNLFEERHDAALHEATALFMQILTVVERCYRTPQRADRGAKMVERVKRHMADHLAEDLSLADLANLVGIGSVQLNRLFHAYTEGPPMRHLRRLRAKHAQALLHRRDLKAADVGRAVGYPTLQHFSRMFKHETGMTVRRFVRDVVGHTN